VKTADLRPLGRSVCTRCADVIPPELLRQFLADDHLCVSCHRVSDVEYAQQVIASERQSTVPPEAAS